VCHRPGRERSNAKDISSMVCGTQTIYHYDSRIIFFTYIFMNQNSIFTHQRNSKLQLNEVYFWNDTIKDWKHLLKQDKYKQLVIDTLKELVEKKMITVYGFVIMPNHLHLLWEMLRKNSKEMPYASFNKATAHEITKDLKEYHPKVLEHFRVDNAEREYRIWKRDPLGVLMDNKKKFEQKLDYIHNNPLQEKWSLTKRPEDYKWSSAAFYETGIDSFGFLTHYMERFG
jgi:putative transposase